MACRHDGKSAANQHDPQDYQRRQPAGNGNVPVKFLVAIKKTNIKKIPINITNNISPPPDDAPEYNVSYKFFRSNDGGF